MIRNKLDKEKRERDEPMKGGNQWGQRGRLDRKDGRGKGYIIPPGPDILTVLHIVAWRGNSHAATYPMLMSVQFSSLFYNFWIISLHIMIKSFQILFEFRNKKWDKFDNLREFNLIYFEIYKLRKNK